MSSSPGTPSERVSLSKMGARVATPPPGTIRPREVMLAAGALVLAGVAAFAAAISLYGERGWLTTHQSGANATSVSNAVKSAVSQASKSHSDAASASASASASATGKYPLGGSKLHDNISRQQSGALIAAIIVMAAVAFLAFGVYKGRHWSRWGVTVFWLLASFTGTAAGIGGVLAVGSSVPAPYKLLSFVAGLSLIAAVILVNLRPSTAYFALSRPSGPARGPQRRGLFAPRVPAGGARGARPSTPAAADQAGTTEAEGRPSGGDRQRAKKRASAEAAARGAELARSRAKASKSRRIDT